jgi:predicted RNase H-like HicB family nuclease
VRVEVELVQQEDGLFSATAVAYPSVTVTGRTEKEALGLIMEAVEKHMKEEARKTASGA